MSKGNVCGWCDKDLEGLERTYRGALTKLKFCSKDCSYNMDWEIEQDNVARYSR